MIHEIAKVTGLIFNPEDANCMLSLRRIERKMPLKVNVNLMDQCFIAQVLEAKSKVDAEGDEKFHLAKEEQARAFVFTERQAPKVNKIRPSLKGTRIKVAGPDGVRYSFGPVWNESVRKGKGPSVSPHARGKLNHQALLLGVCPPKDIAGMDVHKLVKLVAAGIDQT